MNLKRCFALTMAALPLMAQTAPEFKPFEFGVNTIIANADMNKMVRSNNLAGYAVSAAYRVEMQQGLDARAYISMMSLRGKDGSGLQNPSRPHTQIGLDVVQNLSKWSVFGGISTIQWKQGLATDPRFVGTNSVTNMKLGIRLGAEYAFGNGVSGTLVFNQAEFNKVLNPSWYAVGVTYRFN